MAPGNDRPLEVARSRLAARQYRPALKALELARAEAWRQRDLAMMHEVVTLIDETLRATDGSLVRLKARNLRALVLSNCETLAHRERGVAGEIDAEHGTAGSDRPPPVPMGMRSKLQVVLAIIGGFAGFVGLLAALVWLVSDVEGERPRIALPYAEDFSASECGWSTSDDEISKLECAEGGYRFVVKQPNWLWLVNESLSDEVDAVFVETDATWIRTEGSEPPFIGVACLAGRGDRLGFGTTGEGYGLGVEDGSARIWRFEDEGETQTTLAEGPAPVAETARIRGECIDERDTTTLRLLVDTEEILVTEDADGFSSFAEIGLIVGNKNETVEVLFDNIVADTPNRTG